MKNQNDTMSYGEWFAALPSRLDHWFFGHGSPVTLGVFRAIFCGLIFINLMMILPFFSDFYSEAGYVPIGVNKIHSSDTVSFFGLEWTRLNLLASNTNDSVTLAVYLMTAAAALLSCLGLFTRISLVFLAIGIVTLHHRNLLILHGGDTVMRVMTLYLLISPCGLAVSLDRVIGLKRGSIIGPPRNVSLWGLRLIEIQVAIVYFTTVWHKWGGHFWREGTAVWYPLQLNEFDKFWLPGFVETEWFVKSTTYGTLVVELALATLVFYKPWRKWVLISGIAMHAFIEYSLNIPLFAFLMCSTYVCFYEGDEISAWWDRVRTRLRKKQMEPAGV